MVQPISDEMHNLLLKAKEDNLQELELSWLRNTQFPQLDIIPDEICELANLRVLKISYHAIKALPKKIEEMQNLREIYLPNNQFWTVPEPLRKLTNLEVLDVRGNSLEEIPRWLTELKNLRELYLSGSGRSIDLSWIGEMENLNTLVLTQFYFPTLPEWIVRLNNLEYLGLPENEILEIPEEFYKMSRLKNLDVSKNKIIALSPDIINLKSLKKLYVDNNPILEPPLEVAQKGIEAVWGYYRQTETSGIDYLYEAKLLILGEGDAGKTTLAKKILDSKYHLHEPSTISEPSTKGIDVLFWSFELPNGHTFRVNIWDFGGQEIYHATHQFFLTKRSLYALVADARREDTDFNYWLNVIQLLSDKSPVLIIKNEKFDRTREIDEKQLHKTFRNLRKTIATNLANNRGLDEVKDLIKEHISTLPHVGHVLPRTWVLVRLALEKDSRNYISLEEYLEICEEYGFTNLKDKLQLSSFLHDLGTCLHFQDDPVLKNIVILKPKWGTDAVYRVLDEPMVTHNKGCFTRSDLDIIWYETKYASRQDELLQLMMKFRLCYKIPYSNETYIAPQLLGINRPYYDWDDKDNLQIRYIYAFMPKGIITQFIVLMHDRIEEQELVWRNGVVIEQDEAKGEVIEYYSQREIHVRVSGKRKKDLLIRIDERLEEIHKSYTDLSYKKLIPCTCSLCKDSLEPEYYPRQVLYKCAEARKQIQCRQSFEMLDPRKLIDDVLPLAHEFENMGEHRFDIHFGNPNNILIVAVTKSEVQAILEAFSANDRLNRQRINDKTYYNLGTHGGKQVFLVQSEMGTATPGGALLTVNQAIIDLNPQTVIMCGIAYGLRSDVQQLGDILVAKQLLYYETQKVDMTRGVLPRGDRITVSERLLDRFRSGDVDWEGAKTHFGLMVTGEKLVNDVTFRKWILLTEPEAIGGEMEGEGLYVAARRAKVDWIIVKAICDWADGEKDDNAQQFAASNAAKFVFHVIRSGC